MHCLCGKRQVRTCVVTLCLFAAPMLLLVSAKPLVAADHSPCRLQRASFPSEQRTPLGWPVTVTLRIDGSCPDETAVERFVLAVQTSMAPELLRKFQQSSGGFVNASRLGGPFDGRASIIAFDRRARQLCPLTSDPVQLARCRNGIRAGQGNRLDLGIRAAVDAAQSEVPDGRPLRGSVTVVTDGKTEGRCIDAAQAAAHAGGRGVQVHLRCPGHVSECDRECINLVRRSVGSYNPSTPGFNGTTTIGKITISATVASNMRLLDARMSPLPSKVDPNQGHLRWLRYRGVPSQGLSLTFRVAPLALGWQPVFAETAIDFEDGHKRLGEDTIDPLWLDVYAGAPTLSPTPSPTARPTPGPSPTPSPEASRTPRPTPAILPTRTQGPTRTPGSDWRSIHLPRLGKG